MRAWCSSSCHWDTVKGDLLLFIIPAPTNHHHQHQHQHQHHRYFYLCLPHQNQTCGDHTQIQLCLVGSIYKVQNWTQVCVFVTFFVLCCVGEGLEAMQCSAGQEQVEVEGLFLFCPLYFAGCSSFSFLFESVLGEVSRFLTHFYCKQASSHLIYTHIYSLL